MEEVFSYQLGQEVALSFSNEKGVVIARAQYLEGSNCYLVRYLAGDGRQVESWWGERALRAE